MPTYKLWGGVKTQLVPSCRTRFTLGFSKHSTNWRTDWKTPAEKSIFTARFSRNPRLSVSRNGRWQTRCYWRVKSQCIRILLEEQSVYRRASTRCGIRKHRKKWYKKIIPVCTKPPCESFIVNSAVLCSLSARFVIGYSPIDALIAPAHRGR